MKAWPLLLLVPAVLNAQDDPWGDEDWDEEESGIVWNGFIEAGLGTRFSDDPLLASRNTLEDVRWRFETEWQPTGYQVSLKAEAGYDGIENERVADLRDLSVSFRLGQDTDIAVGRQVQTWGTGDLVFLNDRDVL